ncbi:MAG: hypothetical protein QM687_11220 [Ferruginibacter sp.]
MLKTEQRNRNDIVAKFNEVGARLDSLKNAMPDSSSGVGATEGFLPIKLMNSSTILLVDSLIEKFEKKQINRPELKAMTVRLLNNIREVNTFKWTVVDSVIPDTISYWKTGIPFTYEKWLDKYFIKNGADSSIAYLKELKKDIIRNKLLN